MNRRELRFRILFDYYDELHSPPREETDTALQRIHKMDVPGHEKNAAMIWLIEYELVSGRVIPMGRQHMPSIGRINSRGIDFVESVMDDAFTQIKGEFTDIDKLTTTDKITTFAKKCLKSSTTGKMCQATFDAIIKYMANLQLPS